MTSKKQLKKLPMNRYSATQQESRFFSRVACRLVFFHRSQKTPRRHTKTFCLASAAIVHKAAYKYVCIDDAHWGRLKYVTYHFSRDRLSHSWPNGDQADFFVLWRTWYYRSTLLQRFSARRSSPCNAGTRSQRVARAQRSQNDYRHAQWNVILDTCANRIRHKIVRQLKKSWRSETFAPG